jgi:hypothetical protein
LETPDGADGAIKRAATANCNTFGTNVLQPGAFVDVRDWRLSGRRQWIAA